MLWPFWIFIFRFIFSRILCLIGGNVRQACSSSAKTAERINETATLTRPTGLLNSDFRREICICGERAPPREILWSVVVAFGHSEWNSSKPWLPPGQAAFVKWKATILVQTHGGGWETIRHDMLAAKQWKKAGCYRCPQLNEKLKLRAPRRSWTANFHFILHSSHSTRWRSIFTSSTALRFCYSWLIRAWYNFWFRSHICLFMFKRLQHAAWREPGHCSLDASAVSLSTDR